MRKKRNDSDLLEENMREEKTSVVKAMKRKVWSIGSNEEEDEEGQVNSGSLQLGRVVVILVVLVGGIMLHRLIFAAVFGGTYNSYEVVEETGVTNAAMIDYVPYQEALLKYSRDGAVYVDEKGEAVWNETFAMKMPVADVCGDYVAIADLNGNDVYIFNTEGKVSSSTMPYTVCDVAVAGQGEFAVILEGEKENYINLYDRNGDQISEIQTTIDKSGYPLDVDLSVDGEKLFSSYLYIDGGNVKNGLAAYNFGAVGQNENADRLMGGYQIDNAIAPKVEFLDNNTICAFGDTKFIIYTMKEKPSIKATIEFDSEIKSVVFNSQYVGVVMENDSDDSDCPYILRIYNTNGHEVMHKEIDIEYENVRMNEEEIVFTGGVDCRIITIKGRLKFAYSFSKNVKDVIPTGYSRRYIALYDNGSEVIRIKHEREKE